MHYSSLRFYPPFLSNSMGGIGKGDDGEESSSSLCSLRKGFALVADKQGYFVLWVHKIS